MTPCSRRDWLRLLAMGALGPSASVFRAAPVCDWAPKYPAAPGFESLYPLIDPAKDKFREERHAFRVEAFLARWKGDPLRGDYKGPIDLREFKVTRIDINSEVPLTLRCRIRFEFARRSDDSPWCRLGEADVELKEEAGQMKVAAVRNVSARELTLPRKLYKDITQSVFADCPSFHAQLSAGIDHWRERLDAATGIDVYGNSGLAVGDIDNDGYDDLYVCQPGGLPNRLYRNRGDGTFEDVTDIAGVGVLDSTASALFVDFDNRGFQDLLVVCASGPLLFRNDGKAQFRPVPDAFAFDTPPQGAFTGAAAADFDGDGLADVYFCVYSYYQGLEQYRYPSPYYDARNGPPNFLFRNTGNGRFRDITAAAGLNVNNNRFSFACSWCDFDGSGRPSLYVANDFGAKNLYKNNGDGTFTDVASQSGLEDIGAGMSAAWADWHGSGLQDLYVANMWTAEGLRLTAAGDFPAAHSSASRDHYRKHAMGNTLFRNKGAGQFEDVTLSSGAGFGRWSWSSDAIGQDLYVTNGMITGNTNAPELNSFFWRQVVAQSPELARRAPGYEQGWSALNERVRAGDSWSGSERNVYFRNRGDGVFEDVSALSGLDTNADSRAFVLADIDGDGRPELILRNRTGPQVQVFRTQSDGAFLAIRLRGANGNRDAIGASVRVSGAFTQELRAGSGFLSQHSKELFFPLKQQSGAVSVQIRWPAGEVQTFDAVPVNSRIEIVQGTRGFSIRARNSRAAVVNALRTAPATTPGVWLLAPLAAWPIRGYEFPSKPNLVVFAPDGCAVPRSPLPEKRLDPEAALEYSVIHRYVFDVRRDLPVPAAFLVDEHQQIRKLYSGEWTAEQIQADVRQLSRPRQELALPFPGRYYFRSAFERNYYTFGLAFNARGLPAAAETAFRRALLQNPDHPESLYSLGSVLMARKDWNEAKQHLQAAVHARPGYAEAWNNLGIIAVEADNPAEAERCWRTVVSLQPEMALGHLNLGTLYRRQGRLASAQGSLETAAKIDQEDPEISYQRGMLAAQQNRFDAAEALLRESLRLRSTSAETMNNIAILLVRRKQTDEALTLLERAIQAQPEFDQAYLNLARIHVTESRPAEARRVLQALLSRQPQHSLARTMLDRLP